MIQYSQDYDGGISCIEIISVLGKYARGRNGGFQKCMRPISETGSMCTNKWYIAPQAKWNRRKVNMWLIWLICREIQQISHVFCISMQL